ncbi:glutamic acid-rich protein-like [Benincasa hispida]|uniref:glutamic acid-rich protein-like n=1 Tax=Benincasa hispida TaxID=102211 RepID=UPI00190211E0|nr:glutamic acid-rich protein-like [Benincasa hispida]
MNSLRTKVFYFSLLSELRLGFYNTTISDSFYQSFRTIFTVTSFVPTEQELQSNYYAYFAELETREMDIEKEKEGRRKTNVIGRRIASLQEAIEELKRGQEDIKKDINEKHKEILDILGHIKESISDKLPQKEKQSQESLEKNKAPSSSLELLDASLEVLEAEVDTNKDKEAQDDQENDQQEQLHDDPEDEEEDQEEKDKEDMRKKNVIEKTLKKSPKKYRPKVVIGNIEDNKRPKRQAKPTKKILENAKKQKKDKKKVSTNVSTKVSPSKATRQSPSWNDNAPSFDLKISQL